MLPKLVLDNENFDEIMAAARNKIISLYPEWTDFNYHDPGITLLEMFSWLKESQQFFMDQIGDETKRAYLKLLGMRRRVKIPAGTQVMVRAGEDVTVLPGTRLWAGDTCFEAEGKKHLTQGDVALCLSAGGELFWQADRGRLLMGQGLRQPVFGKRPERGCCLYVGFDRALPCGERLDLYLDLFDGYRVRRNPAGDAMAEPVARFSLQYYGEGGWRRAEDMRDGTLGAIRSGRIYFRLPGSMARGEVFGQEAFFLRLSLERQSYEVPPLLEHISVNTLWVTQRETLIQYEDVDFWREEGNFGVCRAQTIDALNGRNELFLAEGGSLTRIDSFRKLPDFEDGTTTFRFELPGRERESGTIRVVSARPEDEGLRTLGIGTGFPGQEYSLGDAQIEYETFGLMVLEGEGYRVWEKVEDFALSGPEDRHYTLDSATGQVRFGDCIRGMAPEAEIRLFSLSRTKGRKGNVKAGAIDRFDGMEPQDVPAWNPADCQGGRDEESLEETFFRAVRELRKPFTLVSRQDIEQCVMETPGLMIENCRVISPEKIERMRGRAEEGAVYIVVNPFSLQREAGLSDCYRRNILAWLEPRRMVGRQFVLLPPQYVAFEVYADVALLPYFNNAREMVRRTVEQYFEEIGDGFGAVVQYGELYGRLDMLPCVSRVNSLNIDAGGSDAVRERDGSLRLPPNGVPLLKDVRYMFSAG